MFKNKINKSIISSVLIIVFLFEIFYPSVIFALTSGPSQPEVQSFEPVSTTQMVDPFTGDFTYNIPLLDVGGYPINISYHSGVGMDQEASWVGLGWNINPGVVNRNMRGLPDDFDGDVIESQTKSKYSVNVGFDPNVYSKAKLVDESFGNEFGFQLRGMSVDFNDKVNYEIYYNNYKGVGYNIHTSVDDYLINPTTTGKSNGGNSIESVGSLGLGFDSQNGILISPSVGFENYVRDSKNRFKYGNGSLNVSMHYNSHSGLQNMGIGVGLKKTQKVVKDYRYHLITKGKSSVKRFGIGGGSSYSFANEVYTPSYTPNTFSFNYNAKFKYYIDKSGSVVPKSKNKKNIQFNVGVNGVKDQTVYKETIGFLNEANYNYSYLSKENVLMDLDNGSGVAFNKYTNNLSPIQNTYDMFSVSSQGFVESFKPSKNYFQVLSSPANKKFSVSNISTPFEFGKFPSVTNDPNVIYAKSIKIGADPELSFSWGGSGIWSEKEGNLVLKDFSLLQNIDNINSLAQKTYFKPIGEPEIINISAFQALGENKPMSFRVSGDQQKSSLFKIYQLDGVNLTLDNAAVITNERKKTNSVFVTLSAKEASKFGLNKEIYSYSYNPTSKINDRLPIGRTSNFRKSHHISEVTTTGTNGLRYVYGLPVYNKEQTEYVFNVGEYNPGIQYFKDGTVTYQSSDISLSNNKGIDQYYNSEKLPSYVHSWMLTAVLSSDYVDLTGDGPTNDDLGTYTKFNYQKLSAGSDVDNTVYNWRIPFNKNAGVINRGLKSDNLDDKALLTTGQREVWYLQSVETKTHIAIFSMSDREDGIEASPINVNDGGKGTLKLKKLDRIDLYSLVDFYQNTNNRIPLKSVHFQYSYDLCPNVSNNSGNNVLTDHPLKVYDNIKYNRNVNQLKGKLTLHKIWFTFGSSLKGSLNPYIFEYNSLNPDYAIKSTDRWGNYLPWNFYNGLPNNYSGTNSHLNSNSEYPYVPQESAFSQDVNNWASAWCLTDIRMPTGGKIKVTYESDDYAYVQNKRAMQMVKIAGFAKEVTTGQMSNLLYDKDEINRFIYFKMPDNGTNINDFIDGIGYSFLVSCYVKLNENDVPVGSTPEYDHIETFVEWDKTNSNNAGIKVIGGQNYGYLAIVAKGQGDNIDPSNPNKIHPVTKAALQFLRMNVPHLAYPGNAMARGEVSVKKVMGNLMTFIPEFARTVLGYEKYMLKFNGCREVVVDNSYIRLVNANGFKKGGGLRVKKLVVSDSWDEFTSGDELKLENGQEFIYETFDEVLKKVVSSGVAAYEPLVGGNENPFRERIQFDNGSFTIEEKNLFAPNNFKYETGPIGENYFPGPMVGYSKITVKRILPGDIDPQLAKRHNVGVNVHEFYTARDFPTIVNRTPIQLDVKKNMALGLLGFTKESAIASQGFVIELNDMHGKLKSFKQYGEYDNKVVSGVEYEFLTAKNGSSNTLVNTVPMLEPTGEKVYDKMLGVDVEVNNYVNYKDHNYLSGGAKVNAHFLYPNSQTPPLIPVLNIIPSVKYSNSVVKQSIVTKIIHRKGILKKIANYSDDARTSSENLCWDAITGDVLLSKMQNDHWSWDYELKKPVHWIEPGMSSASINVDAKVLLATIGGTNPGEVVLTQLDGFGTSTQNSIGEILFPGDELIPTEFKSSSMQGQVANDLNGEKYWVLSIGNGKANLINKNGDPLPQNSKPYYFRIIRSGHRNLSALPAESIISISDPTAETNWQSKSTLNNVLSGSAITYSDKWQMYYQKEMKARINCELTQQSYYEEIISTIPPFSIFLPSGKQTDFNNSTNWPSYSLCDNRKNHLPGSSVNPYLVGVRGNWRPWCSMVYFDRTNSNAERTQNWIGNDPNQIDVNQSGLIQNYVPFFQRISSQWLPQWTPGSPVHNQWTWKDRTNLIGPNGEAVETIDKLGFYSSALFGYNKSLPLAVATKSQYHQMMFDGFEEYDQGFFTVDCAPGNALVLQNYPNSNPFYYGFSYFNSICNNIWHWPLWKALANGSARISQNLSHTGKQSLMIVDPYVPQSGSVPAQPSVSVNIDPNTDLTGSYGISSGRFYLSQGDFIPQFCPVNNSSEAQFYIISYWVYGSGEVKLKDQLGTELNVQQIGNSVVIDGWKRIECKVTLPVGKSLGQICFFNYNIPYLNNGSSGNPIIQNYLSTYNVIKPVYFDDLRILPYMSNMSSYVFERVNNRLMANLDENNFATFIEYDIEGNAVRTKVETEKGIITLQETRSSINKK